MDDQETSVTRSLGPSSAWDTALALAPYLDRAHFSQLPILTHVDFTTSFQTLPTSKAWKSRCLAITLPHPRSDRVCSLLQACEHTYWVHLVESPLCPPGGAAPS